MQVAAGAQVIIAQSHSHLNGIAMTQIAGVSVLAEAPGNVLRVESKNVSDKPILTSFEITEVTSMDQATLAQQAMAIIIPALPYLTSAASGAAEAIGAKIGETTWATAQRLWDWIKGKLLPTESDVLSELANNPNDEQARAALLFKLRKLFEKDAATAQGVASLVQQEGVIQKVSAERSKFTRVAQHASGQGSVDQRIDSKDSELTDVIQSKR